jgi:hypothetical protein
MRSAAQKQSREHDAAAFPPQLSGPWVDVSGCCGVDPPLGRPAARMPGNAPAGPLRSYACGRVSEVSLGEILEHRLLRLCF